MKRIRTLALLLLPLLAGCSSVPERIRTPLDGAATLQQVRQAPQRFTGTTVRWGGTIARVENQPDATLVEIVARELYRDGEPKRVDRSEGRFIARISGFLDPAIHAIGRRLTLVGTLRGEIEGKIGAMNYRYPLLDAEAHYLWPLPPEPVELREPWLYDPWYPWRPYPYY